ncbi:MAG: putative histidine kinase, classic [Herminiimonas sp.]|nr:putative histidine kinase, classic [Herminiimonas sp.]
MKNTVDPAPTRPAASHLDIRWHTPAHGEKQKSVGITSLHAYLGIALTILIVVLSLALAGFLDRLAQREVLRLAYKNLENTGQQMARELASGMNDFSREIRMQAQSPRLQDARSSPAELRAILDEFVQIHPEFAFLGVVDVATATIIAANNGIFEGGNAKGRPVFEEGKKGLFLGDVHEAVRLAELLPKPANGDPLRFLDVAFPIEDNSGRITRVLSAHVSFEWTNQVRENILGPLKHSHGMEILLLDTAGKVVLAPDDQIRIGTPLTSLSANRPTTSAGIQTWSDNKPYLTVAAPVIPRGSFQGFGWQVLVRQPASVALAPTESLRNSFFAGALLLAAAAAVIAWLIAARITKPVRALAESAEQLMRDPSATPGGQSAIGEVAQVQNAINKLAHEGRRHATATVEQLRQFTTFSDFLPHLVFQADADGRLEYMNKRWLRELGPCPSMRLEDLTTRMHEADCQAFLALWKACRDSGYNLEMQARLSRTAAESDARWFKIRAQAVRNEDGHVFRWVGTLTNVHQAVIAAEKMESALEQERNARLEIEHVSRMKDEFLATLSHELRTPLSVIGGWAQMLGMRMQNDAYVTKAADTIRRNVGLQTDLINNLLDMSAVLAGKVDLETQVVDGVELLATVRDEFVGVAENKQLVIKTALPAKPVFIRADARRFHQIMSSLLNNAIKFTDKDGVIAIEAIERENRLEIRVIDTGCGIAPEFLPYVFDRFRQQDSSSTRKQGGIGLGLAIAKSLVELHNGAIRVECAGIGQGCVFIVTLPAVHSRQDRFTDTSPDDDEVRLRQKITCKRILVVEDEANVREIIMESLHRAGARVTTAASAAEALTILNGELFDLLLCDIGMPEMDGYAFLRAVRSGSNPAVSSIPAIALTAFAMRQDRIAARDAGFQRHIAKPFDIDALVLAIEQTLPEESVAGV